MVTISNAKAASILREWAKDFIAGDKLSGGDHSAFIRMYSHTATLLQKRGTTELFTEYLYVYDAVRGNVDGAVIPEVRKEAKKLKVFFEKRFPEIEEVERVRNNPVNFTLSSELGANIPSMSSDHILRLIFAERTMPGCISGPNTLGKIAFGSI